MGLPGGHIGAAGIWSPTQAESVIVTDNESYAIMESVEAIIEKLNGEHAPEWIMVHPKEGGRALVQLSKVVAFVSQGGEAQT